MAGEWSDLVAGGRVPKREAIFLWSIVRQLHEGLGYT